MNPHIEPRKGLFFLQCVMEGSVGRLARGIASDSGEWLANAPRDGLLNLFFALKYSLAKVLNALRLDDAP